MKKNKKWSLKKVREWYKGWTHPGNGIIDPWIEPLIKFINRLPGCATLCSCAGAGPIGCPINEQTQHPPTDTPYVFMLCRNLKMMALLVMAYHVSGGFEVSYNADTENIEDLNEGTISFHFNNWKEVQVFEKALRKFVRSLHNNKIAQKRDKEKL